MKNGKVHSEEWITDAREYWWNQDYLNLLISRYNLEKTTSFADIGCGTGYITKKLLKSLKSVKKVVGIDIEDAHILKAKEIINDYPYICFDLEVGNAESLNIESNSVDLCICQTLLLHVENPIKVIEEMKRITKPGGIIIAIETNNSINDLVQNSFVGETDYANLNIPNTLKKLEYNLTIQKGIYNLNEGYLSIGDYLPKLFLEAKLKEIDISILDKACSLIPPYDTAEKKARARELLSWIESSDAEYDYNQMLKYFLAGGGNEVAFKEYWNILKKETEKIKNSILSEKYIMPGGALMYIAVGKK